MKDSADFNRFLGYVNSSKHPFNRWYFGLPAEEKLALNLGVLITVLGFVWIVLTLVFG